MKDDHLESREPAFFHWMFNVIVNWTYIFVSFSSVVYVFNLAVANQFSLTYTSLLLVTFILAWFFVGSRQHALSLLGHDG
ncbi:hypothetical protein KC845_04195, partial [Candidatus Kaiserbacteria bacterium]|nr:hypothetical protein [Candidatus Kaiserbacteria bacterium]